MSKILFKRLVWSGVILILLTASCRNTTGYKSEYQAPSFNGAISFKPAERWEASMLTGNGIMGAMMYGDPYNDRIIINHSELFLPLGSMEFVQDMARYMPELKKAGLEAGKNGPQRIHEMMRELSGQKIIWTDPFHPAFMLNIKYLTSEVGVSDYKRTQNFENGELITSWSTPHGNHCRRMFISRPDNVVIMEITGNGEDLDYEVSLNIDHKLIDTEVDVSDSMIKAHAEYVNGKGGYDNIVKVILSGGELRIDGKTIKVSGADTIRLLMQVLPWKAPLEKSQSEAWAYSPDNPYYKKDYPVNRIKEIEENLDAVRDDYKVLLNKHARVHGELFSRVSLKLGQNDSSEINSEEMLLRASQDGEFSPQLAQKLYDASRYLIICSTGANPPNLQGIWTGTWTPAWSGDYTLDSNLQLEIQSIMSCNMPELMESYFSLVESWLEDCRLNALKFYGCRGIVSNTRASNTCLLMHWGNWPGEQCFGNMGWMLHFFYDYYQFTGDRDFLQYRVIPLLKESALFYEDLLKGTEDENGKYRFYISYSPEQDHKLYANSTFDIAVAKAIYRYLIKSCKTLGIEEEHIQDWESFLSKLPDYVINQKGELSEWAWPGVEENYNQRHHSHLLPLYQLCEFDRDEDPVMWKAARLAFEAKTEHFLHNYKNPDSKHITHGIINQAQCAARVGQGDIVYEVLARLATDNYIYPGFMISYWPGLNGFGFDPVGTLTDVINNSLAFVWD